MKLGLLPIIACLSLPLLLLTVVLWVDSYSHGTFAERYTEMTIDDYPKGAPVGFFMAHKTGYLRGQIFIAKGIVTMFRQPLGWQINRDRGSEFPTAADDWSFFGFVKGRNAAGYTYAIPHWILALIFAIAPTIWFLK